MDQNTILQTNPKQCYLYSKAKQYFRVALKLRFIIYFDGFCIHESGLLQLCNKYSYTFCLFNQSLLKDV